MTLNKALNYKYKPAGVLLKKIRAFPIKGKGRGPGNLRAK